MGLRQAGEKSLPATPLVGVVPARARDRSAHALEPQAQAPVARRIFSLAFLTQKNTSTACAIEVPESSSYPTRIRTWTNRIKICCADRYTIG